MPDETTINEETTVIEPKNEPISEPAQDTEPQTAQIPVSEPLTSPEVPNEPTTKPIDENIPTETKPVESETGSEAISEPVKIESNSVEQIPETKSEPVESKSIPVIISKKNLARELLIKARNIIQFRKKKKLDKVMTLFLKQSKITNDEVEKFMHVSAATATRYLSQLEKENKIKQTGKTGKSVFYSKI